MGRKRKQYIEEEILNMYSDFPLFVNDNVIWEDSDRPMHFHYYMEIGCCFNGKGILSSNNRFYHVKKGDITLVAANILHNTKAEKGIKTQFHHIYVDIEEFLKMFAFGDVKIQLKMIEESCLDVLYIDGEKHPDIVWIVEEIIRLYSIKKANYKKQIIGLMFTLMFKVYDVFSIDFQEQKDISVLPIMPAIQYVFENYMKPIKVADLAKCCHFSESYFRKVFMEMKGVTPMDYVNSVRIQEACKMLRNTSDNIHVIGEKCGYLSATTFERNFKQKVGILPSQYRDNYINPRKKHNKNYEIKRIYHSQS